MKDWKKMLLAGVGAMAIGAMALAQNGPNNQTPAYQGSISVANNQGEAQEAQEYTKLAKVSMQDAVKAAQAYVGTTQAPTSVQLGNENGYLVWEVVIGGQEIKVDAGTGKVLHAAPVGHEDGRGENYEGGQQGEDEQSGEGE